MKFLCIVLIALSLSSLSEAQTNQASETIQPNQTNTDKNSSPKSKEKTKSQVTVPAVRTPVIRPEPAPVPVPATAKSADQIEFEDKMQIRFDEAVKTVKDLQTRLETYEKAGKDISLDQLRTAQGNRSVTRTKLKQLKFISPSQWSSLQSGIDKAFTNLDSSILTLKTYVESLGSTSP